MKRLLLILLLLATPLAAQDLLASQDPALVQAAKSGDPQAAFELDQILPLRGGNPICAPPCCHGCGKPTAMPRC